LKCAHCMVPTVSPRDAEPVSLDMTAACRFAVEMPELARMGITRVSFTGGEPFLAEAQLSIIAAAAAAAGIKTTVVTACHWAKTFESAAKFVARFPFISDWHLSTDLYHAEFLRPAYVIHAAKAVAASGAQVLVRMAVGRDLDPEERALTAWVRAQLSADIPIALQPVSPVGRAKEIGVTPDFDDARSVPDAPCLTTGPLIQHTGRLLPCCSALSEKPEISPFATADASVEGLPAAVRAWRSDPLLTLVRALGFGFPVAWAEAAGAARVSPAPRHPCDYCTMFFSSDCAREAARAKAEEAPIRAQIEALSRAVFDVEPRELEVSE